MLKNKSLVELRGIAQAYGIIDIFQKDQLQLVQAIELRQQAHPTAPVLDIPRNQYDARLMSMEPAGQSSREEIEEILTPHVARGLHLSFDEEQWYMKRGNKSDEGTMRMPLRVVLRCAEQVMT